MKFRNTILDNGLEVIAECNEEAHTQAVAFFVKTGARDENDELWGVSHFLEHMAFKGTPTRDAIAVNSDFDAIGSHPNAYTSDENTVYHAAVLPEYQNRVVELLADLLRPALRPEDFDTEKQVILEEIQMYEDQPPFGADDKGKAAFFGKHPLARSVLGTIDSVSALTVDGMRSYFERRYSPRNIVLAAAGKVDFDELVKSAELYCGSWKGPATDRPTTACRGNDTFEILHKADSTQEYVLQFALGPSALDDDLYAAKLLSTIIGDETGSRIYWDLVDPGRVESAALYHSGYLDAGVYITYFSCDPSVAAENLARIHELYLDVEKNGIAAEELDQARCKVSSHLVLGSERPQRRLFSVGSRWVQRSEYRSVRDDLELVERLKLDDIHAVLAKYPLTRGTTIAVGPLETVPSPNGHANHNGSPK